MPNDNYGEHSTAFRVRSLLSLLLWHRDAQKGNAVRSAGSTHGLAVRLGRASRCARRKIRWPVERRAVDAPAFVRREAMARCAKVRVDAYGAALTLRSLAT